MAILAERWEHGSDFHWAPAAGTTVWPWASLPHAHFGSGRAALEACLSHGRDRLGWKRVYVPAYYCAEVVEAAERVLPVRSYASTPIAPADAVDAHLDDVVIHVDLLGLGTPAPRVAEGVTVIADHTHDPLAATAFASQARFAFASLRKALPIPDGGVLWSPQNEQVPEASAVTPEHAVAAFRRLSAMVRKTRYLAGEDDDKDGFRRDAVAGEEAMGHGSPSRITELSASLVKSVPATEWRSKRRANFDAFRRAFGAHEAVSILTPSNDATPFAVCLHFHDADSRDRTRSSLIARRIYPAVLWPLEQAAFADDVARAFSRQMLALHCDHRYDNTEMTRVAEAVRKTVTA